MQNQTFLHQIAQKWTQLHMSVLNSFKKSQI